jgi:hypothetical protein
MARASVDSVCACPMLSLCWFVDLLVAVSVAFIGAESSCLGSIIAVCADALDAVRVVCCECYHRTRNEFRGTCN